MNKTFCKKCNAKLRIIQPLRLEKFSCPECDSSLKHHEVEINENLTVRTGLKLKAKHGNKKPHFESKDIPDFNRDRQKIVRRQQCIDRENDSYIEIITDYETNEVIHSCKEPLSSHTNKGAAKKN